MAKKTKKLKKSRPTKKAKATKKSVKTTSKATKKAVKKTTQPSKKSPQVIKTVTSLIGQTGPRLTIENSKGEKISLDSFKGKNLVLYFYPKDDTPGCTIEGHEFSALVPQFTAKNTVVFGVSKDSVESHNKFICKYDYKVELLSDHQGKLCDFFDVIKEKNMYGKKYMGIERSTFIIDANGKIAKEFRKVSPPGHAQFILEQIETLS